MTQPDPLACAAILLAAGASTRLGRPKQLVLFEGEPLLRRAARLALAAGAAPVLVIVPAQSATAAAASPAGLSQPDAQACAQALSNLPVTLLPNPQAATGMGSSLRLGMAALAAHAPRAARVLLMVCDQPLLRLDHLQALLTAHAGSPSGIAAASFQPAGQPAESSARPGVPAVFSRDHFPALLAAHGDQGARTLLRTLPVTTVSIPEAAIDIDTPADISRLNAEA